MKPDRETLISKVRNKKCAPFAENSRTFYTASKKKLSAEWGGREEEKKLQNGNDLAVLSALKLYR